MRNENLLTTAEAAEYVRFAKSTLDIWRGKNIGPQYTVIHGKIFYWKKKLDDWLEQQTNKKLM